MTQPRSENTTIVRVVMGSRHFGSRFSSSWEDTIAGGRRGEPELPGAAISASELYDNRDVTNERLNAGAAMYQRRPRVTQPGKIVRQ